MGNCHRNEFAENENNYKRETVEIAKRSNFMDPVLDLLDRLVPKNILKTNFKKIYKIKKNLKCQNDLFYRIKIVQNVFSGRQFKVKTISKDEIYKLGLQKFKAIFTNEMNSLMKLNYFYVEKINAVYCDKKGDKMKIYIITDLVGRTTLLDAINERIKMKKRFSDLEVRKIMRNILYTMIKLKSQNIIYRNLTPDSIVFIKDGDFSSLSLRNFYFSEVLQKGERLKYELTGPLLYMAPEIMQEIGYDCTSDAWSIGILLYMLISLEHPFAGLNSRSHIITKIKSEKCLKNGQKLTKFGANPKFLQIADKLLNEEPSKRLTIESIIDSREFHYEENIYELSKFGNYDWELMDILIAKVKNCPEFHNFVFFLFYNMKDYFLTIEDSFLFDRLYKFIDRNNEGIINKIKIQDMLKKNDICQDYIKYGELMSTLIYTDFFKSSVPDGDAETFPSDFFIVANLIAYMYNHKNNKIAQEKIDTIILELDIDKSGSVSLEELKREFRTNFDKNIFQAFEGFKKSKYFVGDINLNNLGKGDLEKIFFYEHISLVPIN